jgi:hypothetical protein
VNDTRHSLGNALLNDPGVQALVGGRVYYTLGPDSAEMPYVVFQQQMESDQWAFGGRIFQRTEWLVKALATDLSDAEDVEAATTTALDNARFPMTSHVLISCRRVGGVRYAERDAGQTVWHQCGRYEILVST